MLTPKSQNASQSSFSLTVQTSRISRINRADSNHFYRNTITQEELVSAYGQGKGTRAKCPCCGGEHLSVDRKGAFKCFSGCDGKDLFWTFVADDLLPNPNQRSSFFPTFRKAHTLSSSKPSLYLASPDILDLVYRTLLELCPLDWHHQRSLQKRNLPFLFERLQLGSLQDPRGFGFQKRALLVENLLKKTGLSKEVVAGVPGFYLDGSGVLRLAGNQGILIPFYDLQDRIVGMQIRHDRVSDKFPRYLWLSAKSKHGVSGGAPVGFLEGSEESDTIDITEGVFKGVAILGHLFETKGVLCMAGVGMLPQLIERLEELEGIKKARVWFDADSLTNANVLRSLARLVRALQGMGLVVEVKGWDIEKGKGIDDYLAAGGSLEEIRDLEIAGILRAADLRKQTAHLLSSTPSKGKSHIPLLPDTTAIFAPSLTLTKEEMYENTKRATLEALNAKLGAFVVHNGPTGSGKSYSIALYCKENTIYAVDNYKLLFEVEKEFKKQGIPYTILFGRGDRVNPEADTETQILQERIWDEAGCEEITDAKEFGKQAFFPCKGCPLYEKKDEEDGCRYWKQRDHAVQNVGRKVVLTLVQTLASNYELTKELGGQLNLLGNGGANTVIFDDIKDILSHFSRPQDINLDDVERWEEEFPEAVGYEAKKRLEVYRALVRQVRQVITDRDHKISELYKAGRRARDAFDLEEKGFSLFKARRGERPPLNALEALAKWLSEDHPISFVGKGKERSLRFLRPSPLADKLKETRAIYLDATPNRPLLEWFAGSLGMDYQQTNLPQPTQNIIQIGDVLWSSDQLDQSHEAIALRQWIEDQNGFILTKKGRAIEGDAYFGRDERGLNLYQNAPVSLIEGHHAMSEDQAKEAAWLWRAFAEVRNVAPPLEGQTPNANKEARRFGDAWRPWFRTQHTLSDPLAELLRRHHQSAAILQGAARDRDPSKQKFVLSGSPIELNGTPYPVTLWTRKDLRTFLESQGIEVQEKPHKEIPLAFQERNERLKKEREEKIQQALEELRECSELPKVSDIRKRFGKNGKRCRADFAKDVWDRLYQIHQIQQNQLDSSIMDLGTSHGDQYTKNPQCTNPFYGDNSLKRKNSASLEYACVPPPLLVGTSPPDPCDEALVIETDVSVDLISEIDQEDNNSSPPIPTQEGSQVEKMDLSEEEVGEVCLQPDIHTPLPPSEEPLKANQEEKGLSGEERAAWECWSWLGGVAVFEAWRSDPSDLTASILDTALAEFRHHMPDYPLERMIDLLEKAT